MMEGEQSAAGCAGGGHRTDRVPNRSANPGVRKVIREVVITDSARTVVFVCQHGAAKSVMAAAYLNRLAALRGVNVRATAAGTEPEPEVSPKVGAALFEEGIDVRDHRPRAVTREELTKAWRAVSFGCDLSHVAPPEVAVIQWDGVPPASEDFTAAREAIVACVVRLLDECGGQERGVRAADP